MKESTETNLNIESVVLNDVVEIDCDNNICKVYYYHVKINDLYKKSQLMMEQFLDEVKSYIKENSICSVAMNNDFAIMFPLIKDIDLSTIASRIYIDSKEDCADCIECSIVKFHEGVNKKIHVIKREMLTVFETEINDETNYQNSVAKIINWVQEQKKQIRKSKILVRPILAYM